MLLVSSSRVCAERVTATLDADQVDFSYDRRLVSLRGNARVDSQVVDDPTRFVRLNAESIEGDLSRGRFELIGDVRIVTPRGVLEGESAFYDTTTARYSVRKAALMAPLTELVDAEVCGYAYAREITGEDEVVYLVDARFTTCDRANPHYALEVNRLRWNTEAEQIVVEGGGIRLYGVRIPLIPGLRHSVAVGAEEAPELLPVPGYTDREGLRLGWSFVLGEPTADIVGRAGLGLRQRKGIQAWAWGLADVGNLETRFGATVRENNYEDIDHVVSLDRLPEVGVHGSWDIVADQRLSAGITLGHYRQHAEDDVPGVSDDRVLLEAKLHGGAERRGTPGTSWWWVRGSHAEYADGAHYSTVGAGLGGATSLTPWLSGSAELRHHLTDGASPFIWDDIDIETELSAESALRFGPDWGVRLAGRYDLDRNELRSWRAQLRRREHCLTYTLGYSDTGDFLSLGIEINGLFGSEEPPPQRCAEEGPPDYWGREDRAENADSPKSADDRE